MLMEHGPFSLHRVLWKYNPHARPKGFALGPGWGLRPVRSVVVQCGHETR